MLGCFISAGLVFHKTPSTAQITPQSEAPILKNLWDASTIAVDASCTIYTKTDQGSCVFISRDGLALTNAHVVGTSTRVEIKESTGLLLRGRVVKVDTLNDLALLQVAVPHPVRTTLTLAPTDAQRGDHITTVGSPGDRANTVLEGVVLVNGQKLESNLDTQPGSSGGAVINEQGQIVGIHKAIRFMDGAAIAIPVSTVRDFLENP